MRVAFGTVVYPNALRYGAEYAQSLNKQIGQEFDVLLVSDGLSSTERSGLEKLLQRRVVWDIPSTKLTIPELRIELLRSAYNHEYDILVLGDFDDTFDPERVRKVVDSLDKTYTFCYHNLDVNGYPLFSNIPNMTLTIDPILDCNYLGFGNTAINLRALSCDFIDTLTNAPDVFDWYFFTLLLLSGGAGRYIPESLTRYRIYNGNMAGTQIPSFEKVKKEVKVKYDHYAALKNKGSVFANRMKAYAVQEPSISWQISGSQNGCWWSLTRPIA